MIDLPGLSGASPIGFLAALGMLRVLVEDRGHDARLAWRHGRAVLDGLELTDAIDELTANMTGRGDALEFTWADTVRDVTPEQYRNAVARASSDRRALAFLAGWGTDTVMSKGFIADTDMDMTPVNKKQMLPRDLRELAPRVNRNALEIALLGGSYERQSPWGLDPASRRSGATEAKAPGKSKPPGKPGLIWLAIESIPLHPVLPVSITRTRTVGWRYMPVDAYVWPLWNASLSLNEVKLLRMLPVERLASRPGVTEVWASTKDKTGMYPWLLPARRER
ncbi:MAG: hypothetical protein U1F59_13585 [Candidatus Competibacteraceae bacterium]